MNIVRQQVHTVYGGAHLFSSDVAGKFGRHALSVLDHYAPDAESFARLCGFAGSSMHQDTIYRRVTEKLTREPIEDYRIDFEDGFGRRTDKEEDAEAERTAVETAIALRDQTLPPFFGIRLKPVAPETFHRSKRTLGIYLSTLNDRSSASFPSTFAVTIPKISSRADVTAAVKLLSTFEKKLGLLKRTLRLEIMAETPGAFFQPNGTPALPSLIRAADGRCSGVHLGPYDFTASLQISSLFQRLDHPACDFARLLIALAVAGSQVTAVDGPTSTLPVGPHKKTAGVKLMPVHEAENAEVIASAWRLSFQNIRHALSMGMYQGWDLHPAQLPVRYAAMYDYFLSERDRIVPRLRKFIDLHGVAVRSGASFDDAATVRGMVLLIHRGFSCGAFSAEDPVLAGLGESDLDLFSPLQTANPKNRRKQPSITRRRRQ